MSDAVSRRALLAALPAAACIAPFAAADSKQKPLHRVVVLMRHAEKSSDDPRDPDLSDAGRERAARVATLFAKAGATRLLASNFKRTQQTLAPLARDVGIDVTVIPAGDGAAWNEALRDAAHAVTIVATHSNVLPKLAEAVGAKLADLDEAGNIPDAEYGRVVVLTVCKHGDSDDAAVGVLELRT